MPLVAAVILGLRFFQPPLELHSPLAVEIANMLFLGGVGGAVALLALRAYLARGTATLLLLAVAMVLWAGGGVAAAILLETASMDEAVAMFSLAALAAGACHVLGAISAAAGGLAGRRVPATVRSAAVAVTGSLAVVAGLAALVAADVLPPFWDSAGAPTAARLAVLAAAVTEFALAALFFAVLHTRVRQRFFGWYAIGSVQVAMGLAAVLLAATPGDLVAWTGRIAQYLGTMYVLAAVVAAGVRFRAPGLGFVRSLALSFEEAETAYRPLVEAAAEALLSLDEDGRVMFSNGAAQALLARTAVELFGTPLERLGATRGDVESLRSILDALRADPDLVASHRAEVRLARPAGALSIPVEVVLVSRPASGPAPVVAVVRDLTARQATDAALRSASLQLERRVAERTRELEQLTQGLEERVDAATARAQQQAEQLRRLAAELTTAELRERRRLASLLHDHLQQLLVAAKLALASVRHESPGSPAVGRLGELLEESIQAARSLAVEISPPVLQRGGLEVALQWLARWVWEHHGLEVELVVEPGVDLPSSEARALLFQAVREMLFNVVKHSGVLSAKVGLAQRDDEVEVVVRDLGRGFEPSTTGEEGPGTGLGLQSLRDRLTGLGGGLEVRSMPGAGTEARAHLPVAAGVERSTDSGALRTLPPDALRVLLVDPHPVAREGVAALLRSFGIVVVGQSGEGRHALELASSLRPQVVLLDVDIPDLDGAGLIRLLRERSPAAAVVGLTIDDDAARVESILAAGAAACLAKGVQTEQLVQVIRRSAAGHR